MPVLKIPKKIVVGILLFLFCSIFFYYSYLLVQPANKLLGTDVEEVISIKSGTTIDSIAEELSAKGIIVDPILFKIYVRLTGVGAKVRAGYYRLNSKSTISEIVDKLVAGEMAHYNVTIPEGRTVENIALRLSEYGIDENDFLELARTMQLSFLDLKSEHEDKLVYNLEGFLFPDTYQIPYGSSTDEVIAIMLEGFNEKIDSIRDQIQASQYSLNEIVTIASLIQAEGQVDSEFPLISSVIHNRLEINMKLQIDATIQYTMPERKARLLYSDLKVDSLYNTYLNYGLPPGPINSPGLKAIKAALNPAQTDYLYYVASGDGEHKFTKTYQQHLKVQDEMKRME